MTDILSTLHKASDENVYQYLWRVCSAKDCGLLNLSWPELADAINRELHPNSDSEWLQESVYRKDYRAAKLYYDNVFSKFNDEAINDIEAKKQELRKISMQAADQRRELRKYERLEARAEHLHEIILQAVKDLPPFEIEQPIYYTSQNSPCEAILFLNDWHYGMKTDTIWNRYNCEICRKRVNLLCERVCNYLRLHKIQKLNIVLLGDMAHGAIHVNARVAAEEAVCEQLIHVSELLAQLIHTLSGYVADIEVYSTYGNHMRTVQNAKESIHSDNMERIIPWWLKARFDNYKGVEVVEQDEYNEMLHIPVCGYNVIAVHGDLDNLRKIGTTMHTMFSKCCGIDVDYVVMGDKHHAENIEALGIDCTIVPALCGTDDYAHGKRLYSEPGQVMMIFDPEYGRECVYTIRFEI